MLPNLYKNRHGTYYLRLTIGKREIKRSLRTKEPARAKLAAIAFAWARLMDLKKPFPYELPMGLDPQKLRELGVVLPNGTRFTNIETDDDARRVALIMKAAGAGASSDDIIDLLRVPVPGGTPLEKRAAILMASLADKAPGKSKPFSVVSELYLDEHALTAKAKGVEDRRSTYKEFQELHGDLDFNVYGDEHALGWKQRLIAQGLSVPRINTKISNFKMLFEWARNNKLRHTGNPFESMRVSTKGKIKKATQSYEPFTQAELDKIFDPVGYPAFMVKPDYHWLPFLALHTGARIEELASLEVGAIKSDGAVSWIEITKGKNANSIRKVPLDKAVEQSAFPAYAAAVAAAGVKDKQGRKLLFPHLIEGKNGYSKNCSRRFSQWLDKLGIVHRTKTFHSFRGTFINRMSELNTNPAMLMALVGHYEQAKVDLSSPHFQNYQGAKLISALKETIDRFDIKVPMAF